MATTANRFDPQPPDKSSVGPSNEMAEIGPNVNMNDADVPLDAQGRPIDMLALIGHAETLSKNYQLRTIEKPLRRAYRAWQNQHAEGSKYLGTAYRGRSRLFVPKTRSAVRKNLATAAGALFSTDDVVNVAAEYTDDPQQVATAAVLKADLDYRLTRTSAQNGIPWFMIAMGGCLDSQLTGITASKQYWQYEEVPSKSMQTVEQSLIDDATGQPVFDQSGQPVTYQAQAMVDGTRVTFDRPMIELLPIENILLDPAAPWYMPEQLGRWFICRYPMGLSDVRAMLNSAPKQGQDPGWLNVSDDLLLKGRLDDDRSAIRRAREDGPDRYMDGRGTNELDVVWIQENFLRIGGIDYNWWSVGRYGYISRVRETHESYPALDGERPYTVGFAQIDSHRIFPMSPVDSWQPLQLELNDITNLRQDTLKRSIAPLAVVKRGANVDIPALQRRGQPETVVMAQNPKEDIVLVQTPGPTSASYTETNVNNTMFDELAGVFSTSSVQANRNLNETVGGMRLLSGAANSVSEFDLRTWVETWVERALRQTMHLIRAFESNEKLLQLFGAKAQTVSKYNYIPDLSDFNATEVALKVNVGIGALDPMQQLGKLKVAGEMLAPLMGELKQQGWHLDGEVWIDEIMGKAGYRDGMRFFKKGQPMDPSMNPEVMKIKAQSDARVQVAQINAGAVLKAHASDNLTKLALGKMDGNLDLTQMLVDVETGREVREHQKNENAADALHQMIGRQGDDTPGNGPDADGPADNNASASGPPGPKGIGHGPTTARELVAHALQRRPGHGAPGHPPSNGAQPPQGAQPQGNSGGNDVRDRVVGALQKTLGGDPPSPQGNGAQPNGPMTEAPQPGPPGHDPSNTMRDAMLQQTSVALNKVLDRLEQMAVSNATLEPAVLAIARHLTSPVQVIKDPATGKPTGFRKGDQVQRIVRDQNDKITGSSPQG